MTWILIGCDSGTFFIGSYMRQRVLDHQRGRDAGRLPTRRALCGARVVQAPAVVTTYWKVEADTEPGAFKQPRPCCSGCPVNV